MKHIKKFENFSINEEEGILGGAKKFFTGHESSSEKEEARKKFMNDLAEAEDKLKSDPDEYPQSRKWEENKKDLIKKAEEDNFNGGLKTQSSRSGGMYIIYKEGTTGFKSLVSGSSHRTANPLG
jgi:hypothetical protein